MSPAQLLADDALRAAAVELMRRHVDAINAGDREAFRATCYLFPRNDGLPFERWWERLRELAPLDAVTLTPEDVNRKVRARRTPAGEHDPHISVWVRLAFRSGATGRSYEDALPVWCLVETGEWKLGGRAHW